jgi:rhodanese-related sulfurtransferase
MKAIILKFVVLIIFSASFMSCAQNSKAKKDSQQIEVTKEEKVISLISPQDLNQLKDIQLIDVRTPEEFSEGHINDAININFYDDNFIEEMSSKLDKSKPVYVYCRSGGRSGKASKKLEAAGFTKVYDLEGGFMNWTDKKLEVVK